MGISFRTTRLPSRRSSRQARVSAHPQSARAVSPLTASVSTGDGSAFEAPAASLGASTTSSAPSESSIRGRRVSVSTNLTGPTPGLDALMAAALPTLTVFSIPRTPVSTNGVACAQSRMIHDNTQSEQERGVTSTSIARPSVPASSLSRCPHRALTKKFVLICIKSSARNGQINFAQAPQKPENASFRIVQCLKA